MFTFKLARAIAADMFKAFLVGGETAAQACFADAMDYWDTFADQREDFTTHTMGYYRNFQFWRHVEEDECEAA